MDKKVFINCLIDKYKQREIKIVKEKLKELTDIQISYTYLPDTFYELIFDLYYVKFDQYVRLKSIGDEIFIDFTEPFRTQWSAGEGYPAKELIEYELQKDRDCSENFFDLWIGDKMFTFKAE